MLDLDSYLLPAPHDRATAFHELMRHRVHDILVVSSLYDSFLLAQDGQLHEQMFSEFAELNLQQAPQVTRASNARRALEIAAADPGINLVITTPHVGDVDVLEFGEKLRAMYPQLAVVLLAFDHRELRELLKLRQSPAFDKMFLWQGDFRILLAITKYFEDLWNVEHDTQVGDVQVIILIEDSVRFYSSYLPMFYAEVMRHSQNLISESVNLYHKVLRMRARPKVLHCETFEEAWERYRKYEKHVLGIVSDIEFPLAGKMNPEAGLRFIERVKERRPDIPVLLQSSKPETAAAAEALGIHFALKDSPQLLADLQRFMTESLGFGDFVFRLADGTELDRASDMRELELKLHTVREESIRYHAERDHFSNWLKARTEFELADRLKPRKVSDYPTLEALRRDLIESIQSWRRERARGHVADFSPESFEPSDEFVRIGAGSLGGKARGLAFASHLLHHCSLGEKYPDVNISVPPCLVLCTDVFDEFMERNGLREFALNCNDDKEIERRFLHAEFPEHVHSDLYAYLKVVRYPLAVRSSSLLEDSQFHPFAGVYRTYMLANNNRRTRIRLAQLESAVKRVYASMFFARARDYMRVTPHRLEEEKMAVIVQRLVGSRHGERFYPDISGVARSHNFYPSPPMQSSDGVVSVALGLGKTVVEGGTVLRFCPKYPRHLIGLSSPQDYLDYTQRTFYSLDLAPFEEETDPTAEPELVQLDLSAAEEDGTLHTVGSVYVPQEDRMVEGLLQEGVRIVDFAPILKHDVFPLPPLVKDVLDVAAAGMSGPVEMEFAVRLAKPEGDKPEFDVLQLRPLVIGRELIELNIEDHPLEDLICQCPQVMGVGRVDDIRDIVVVDKDRYNRGASREVAVEVGRLNRKLTTEGVPYLLIGVGRWGSSDPWLGIPVEWEQISGARVIVEAGFKDFKVTPSQGAHFFQNITAMRIGYFTVNLDGAEAFLDWDWLLAQPALEVQKYTRRIRLEEPAVVLMNGHKSKGIILKPGKTS